jgi:pterin-4a-carbinolamine dehydratase
MLTGSQIAAETNLTDWRQLGQGLHARYVVRDFGKGARFVAAVGEAGDAFDHHPRVTMDDGYVDLRLVSDDASGDPCGQALRLPAARGSRRVTTGRSGRATFVAAHVVERTWTE